jgi:hypothetical protein
VGRRDSGGRRVGGRRIAAGAFATAGAVLDDASSVATVPVLSPELVVGSLVAEPVVACAASRAAPPTGTALPAADSPAAAKARAFALAANSPAAAKARAFALCGGRCRRLEDVRDRGLRQRDTLPVPLAVGLPVALALVGRLLRAALRLEAWLFGAAGAGVLAGIFAPLVRSVTCFGSGCTERERVGHRLRLRLAQLVVHRRRRATDRVVEPLEVREPILRRLRAREVLDCELVLHDRERL